MDDKRIETTTGNGSVGATRKPYRTPNKLMVLGQIDTVVLGNTHAGNDGHGAPSGS
jgi:hypothetical protein